MNLDFETIVKSPLISMAILGALGALTFSLKEIPTKGFSILKKKVISAFFFTVRIPDYDELFKILEKWLFDNHNGAYKEVQATIEDSENNEPTPFVKRRIPNIIFKSAPNIFSINYKGHRIIIEKKQRSIDNARDFRSLFAHEYIISGFKGKLIITELLDETKRYYYKDLPINSVTVKTHTSSGYFDNSNQITVKPIDKVILDEDLKKFLISDLNEFRASKDWYFNNSLAYKRGYGFYGPPGTGKTSLSLAIASYMGTDVYVININSLSDDASLQRAFSNIKPGSMLLLEDIDSAFTMRNSHCNVTFSALLNCIDGAFYKEGLVTCITTNHIQRLDPALLRAGRLDIKREIPYPRSGEINAFLSQFYNEVVDVKFNVSNMPMADIQEICIKNKKDSVAAINAIRNKIFQISTTLDINIKSKEVLGNEQMVNTLHGH